MKIHWQSDFYAALGLDQSTDQETLRKAYLQLALQYHPDRNPGDRDSEEKFKLISQAYAVLRDPATRGRYDRMRRAKFGKAKTHRTATARKYKDWRPDGQPQYGGFSGGKTQTRPFPGANPNFESQAQSPYADLNRQGPNGGQGSFSPGDNDFAAKSQAHQRPSGQKAKARKAQLDDDIMADLFKTKEGRDSLNQIDEELKNAGLGNGLERMMSQLRQTFSGDQLETVKNKAGNFFRNLKSKILTNPLSAKEEVPPEDIVFGLVLTPEAAASGTTIDISYLRDNQPHHLSVKIPAGITERARLRLTGQGNLKPVGSRGDLLLDLSIKKP